MQERTYLCKFDLHYAGTYINGISSIKRAHVCYVTLKDGNVPNVSILNCVDSEEQQQKYFCTSIED